MTKDLDHISYYGTKPEEKTIELTSNAAKATSEMVVEALENNNSLLANALLHELEDLSHDGVK